MAICHVDFPPSLPSDSQGEPLETQLLHLLLDAAIALLMGLAGVQGGTLVQRRRQQLQLDLLADEVDVLSRRLARRDGQAGRQKRVENEEAGEAEAQALLQQLGAAGKAGRRAPVPRAPPKRQELDLQKRAQEAFEDPPSEEAS